MKHVRGHLTQTADFTNSKWRMADIWKNRYHHKLTSSVCS